MADTVIATIPKNSREEVRISLSEFRGVDLINLRIWFDAKDGDKRPSKDGLALRLEKLPDLIQALQGAEHEARRAGLLAAERTPAGTSP